MSYLDQSLTIPELAERTSFSPERLHEFTRIAEDPLPSIMPGKQKRVHWSDWLEWSTRRLGNEGDLRGKFKTSFSKEDK